MKTQNPLIGRMKGSAGGMTGSKVYDKNVLRAKAFEVNNPNTQAQQTQRGYFSQLTALVAKFTPDQLRTLFPSKPKAMSRRNALSKQLSSYYEIDGSTKAIDLSSLATIGNAPTMVMGTTTAAYTANKLTATLDNIVKNNDALSDNHFIVAFVNLTKQDIYIPAASALVSVGSLAVDLPTGWETTDTFHAIPLITNSLSAITSFGTIAVATRPERA